MLFSDYYNFHFIVKSKDKNNNFAKTYVCRNIEQTDFLSLFLVSGDITSFINGGFVVLRKFKDKYLVANDFALQNTTFEKIIHKHLCSKDKITV